MSARACGVAAVVCWLAVGVQATTVVRYGLRDLCAEATRIFAARVDSVRSRWTDPQQRAIETVVELGDPRELFGSMPEDRRLRFPGGEVDGIRESVAGIPEFTPGERVVLFVRDDGGLSPLVGFSQGCFRIVERQGGEVVHTCDGSPVVASEDGSLEIHATSERGAEAVGLDTFLEAVRSEIRATHP